MKLKIKKGDIVEVISGNDKGQTGRVLNVYPKTMKILVEGINLTTRHSRPTQQDQKGGIKKVESPISYSNVMIVDSDKTPTRIGIRVEEGPDGKKKTVRYALTNGNDL